MIGTRVRIWGALFAILFMLAALGPVAAHAGTMTATRPNDNALNDYPWNGLFLERGDGGDGWGMGYGECVSFAAWKVYENSGGSQHPPTIPDKGWMPSDYTRIPINANWGNASAWANSARNAGIPVDHTPRVGDIAQWNASSSLTVGHVAYVYQVNADGSIELAQYNLRVDGLYSTLHMTPNGATDTSNGHGPFFVAYPDNFLHFGLPQMNKVTTNETTNSGTPLATYNSKLFVAWQGADEHVNVMSTSNGTAFGNKVTLSDTTLGVPTLAGFGNSLYLAFEGTDHSIYIESTSNGTTFINHTNIGQKTNAGPAIAVFAGKLYLAWEGTDKRLNLMSSTDGIHFGNQVILTDTTNDGTGPALNAYNNALYLAWDGTDAAHRIYIQSTTDGTHFANHTTLAATSLSAPGITHNNGLLYLSWAGTDPNHHLNFESTTNGVSFGADSEMGESTIAGPGLASFNGHLYTAWPGTDSAHHLNIGWQ